MNRLEEQRFKDLESKVEQLKQAIQSFAYAGGHNEEIDLKLKLEAVRLKPDNLKEANEIYTYLKEGKLPKK